MVKPRGEKYPKVVYCDMNKLPDSSGFQRTFGSPGNLKEFVAFDAYLNTPLTDDYRSVAL